MSSSRFLSNPALPSVSTRNVLLLRPTKLLCPNFSKRFRLRNFQFFLGKNSQMQGGGGTASCKSLKQLTSVKANEAMRWRGQNAKVKYFYFFKSRRSVKYEKVEAVRVLQWRKPWNVRNRLLGKPLSNNEGRCVDRAFVPDTVLLSKHRLWAAT
jgi:hypothetical protein